MSSKRNPRTRNDSFFGKLIALGKGRFRDPNTGRIYVDSHDMDGFLDDAVGEWEGRLEKAQQDPNRNTELPPVELRRKAARQELETMYDLAAEQAGERKGSIILPG